MNRCRICSCTDHDCSQCIEKTGAPCFWVEVGLCSACAQGLADKVLRAVLIFLGFKQGRPAPKPVTMGLELLHDGRRFALTVTPDGVIDLTDHIGMPIFIAQGEQLYRAPHYSADELIQLFQEAA